LTSCGCPAESRLLSRIWPPRCRNSCTHAVPSGGAWARLPAGPCFSARFVEWLPMPSFCFAATGHTVIRPPSARLRMWGPRSAVS
jgi:hypothetical protein